MPELPTYSDWSLAQRHHVAVDNLRFLESQHYKLSLAKGEDAEPGALASLAVERDKAKTTVEKLEKEAKTKKVPLPSPADPPTKRKV